MFLALSAELFDIGKQQKSLYSAHYQLIKKSYFLLYTKSVIWKNSLISQSKFILRTRFCFVIIMQFRDCRSTYFMQFRFANLAK